MITGTIIGDRDLFARLGARSLGPAKAAIDNTVRALGFELERRVKRNYLTGQVLNVRTGRLRASISQTTQMQPGDSRSGFVSTPSTAVATVGTNVVYGAAWEFGSRAHDIVPIRAKALRFEVGGQVLFRRRVHIPAQAPRPFLRPALENMRGFAIQQLTRALQESMARSLAR